jgi:esterase
MDLNYKVFGAGKNLIILHGLFGMLDNWQNIAQSLSQNFRVFIIDQRNHGRSPHSEEHNYQVMARDLYDFMIRHNIFSASLLGHSMGGKVAMHFAKYYPQNTEKLIIADISPAAYDKQKYDHERIFECIEMILDGFYSDLKEAEKEFIRIMESKRIAMFLLKNLKKGEKGRFSWKFNALALKKNYKKILEGLDFDDPYRGKTLFIKAAKSPYIQAQDYQIIKSMFRDFKIVTIAESSHWVHAEQPELFLSAVNSFLMEEEVRNTPL